VRQEGSGRQTAIKNAPNKGRFIYIKNKPTNMLYMYRHQFSVRDRHFPYLAFYRKKMVAKMQEHGGYETNGKNDIHFL